MTERQVSGDTLVGEVASFADSLSARLHWERCWVASSEMPPENWSRDNESPPGLLRATAINLLCGEAALWTAKMPLTARPEWGNGHPSAVLTALERL